MALLKKRHEQGSLEVRFVDISNTAEVLKALDGAAFLWIESPTNPGLNLAESATIINEAKKRNLGVGFDNTFATPLNQKPLTMGADIVMHSVTKYLAGHSDVILGSVSVLDPALHNRIVEIRTQQGAIAGPFESWLALRGIRTFPLRFKKAQESAALISQKLKGHPKVTDVRYPGFGAIVSFCIDASADAVEAMCDSAELITNATSLGGVESTWERRRRWALESASVPENLVRLSVGCEDPEDIWSDINRAIERSSN
jgi:cystathionine gamma-synthase